MHNRNAYIISALVIIIFAWYYLIHSAFPLTTGFINAITAFSSTIIISLSFLLGPLAKFIPFFRKYLDMRKPFGLVGYGLGALHTGLVVIVLLEETHELAFADIASIVFAGIAFMIFTLMAMTSRQKWVITLGYDNWKDLQRIGYIALAFILFHIVLLEQGVFLERTTGQIAISLILGILLIRGLALVLGRKSPEKIKV